MCVQNFDDSRGPAIRITYRISLRSSSLWEPRHPLLKVVYIHIVRRKWIATPKDVQSTLDSFWIQVILYLCFCIGVRMTIPSHIVCFDKVFLGFGVIM